MAKPKYEGYSTGQHTISLREKFGRANIYAKNAQSILNRATGFIPEQKYMTPLKHQYLRQKFVSNYVIDDYVILAKR